MLKFLELERRHLGDLLQKNMEDAVKQITDDSFTNNTQPAENFIELNDIPLKTSFYHEPEGVRIKTQTYSGRSSWLFVVKGILEKYQNIFLSQRWTILRPAKGIQLFTSDSPVVKLNPIGEGKYDLDGAWHKQNSTIMLPLSPSHIMCTEMIHPMNIGHLEKGVFFLPRGQRYEQEKIILHTA